MRLGFGIAEAAIEFEDLGAGGREHQAEVEEALVGLALLRDAAKRRANDGLQDALFEIGGDHAVAGVGAHAAGVRSAIGVENALVIAAGSEGDEVLAVGQHHVGQLAGR